MGLYILKKSRVSLMLALTRLGSYVQRQSVGVLYCLCQRSHKQQHTMPSVAGITMCLYCFLLEGTSCMIIVQGGSSGCYGSTPRLLLWFYIF